MSKHTPGPWTAHLGPYEHMNDGARPIMAGKEEDSFRVALADSIAPRKRTTKYNAPDAERDANALLIAAAPELLEALKTLAAEEYRDDGDPVLKAARDLARAAIAKAEGA